jgi:hypothetical protein
MRHWKSRILAIALAITMLAAVTPAMAAGPAVSRSLPIAFS